MVFIDERGTTLFFGHSLNIDKPTHTPILSYRSLLLSWFRIWLCLARCLRFLQYFSHACVSYQ